MIQQEGCINLNSNGACKDREEITSCGGFIRDSNRRLIEGFVRNIGICDDLHAEIRGLYPRLVMTLWENISHLVVESNSNFYSHDLQ
jgi:hypothetical protein